MSQLINIKLSSKPTKLGNVHIKMGIREIGFEGLNWIHLAQDRDQWLSPVNTVMDVWVPWKVVKFVA